MTAADCSKPRTARSWRSIPNVDTGQAASGSPPGGTIDAGQGGTVILSANVANGVSGASVPGEVEIDGGTFDMLAGSSVTVPIDFTSNGGTLEISGVSITSVGGAPPVVSAATFVADKAVLDEIVGGVAISDTLPQHHLEPRNLQPRPAYRFAHRNQWQRDAHGRRRDRGAGLLLDWGRNDADRGGESRLFRRAHYRRGRKGVGLDRRHADFLRERTR